MSPLAFATAWKVRAPSPNFSNNDRDSTCVLYFHPCPNNFIVKRDYNMVSRGFHHWISSLRDRYTSLTIPFPDHYRIPSVTFSHKGTDRANLCSVPINGIYELWLRYLSIVIMFRSITLDSLQCKWSYIFILMMHHSFSHLMVYPSKKIYYF